MDRQDTPLLSVITVVRNGGSTIERALADDTVQYIERFSAGIDYWHSKPDAGIAAAFNAGLHLAKGRFVGFLNADDWYAADALGQVIERLKAGSASSQPIEWLCGAVNYSDPTSNFQRIEQAKPEDLPKYMSVYHPSMIVAKTVYERVGAYDETLRYAMDSDWAHRAVRAGVIPTTIPTVIAHMSLGGTSNKNLGAALREYRASVIRTGLSSPFPATYYLLRQWLVHSALKFAPVQALANLRKH